MNKFILIALVFLFSCNSKEELPEGIIPQKEFTQLLFQTQLMESYCQEKYVRPDLYKEILHKSVDSMLQAEGYSKETFEASFDYYSLQPKKMFEIYESILESMNTMQVEISAVKKN